MPPPIRTTLRDARPRRRSLPSEPGVLLLANIMVISVTASATLAAARARPPRARPTAAAASREGPRSRSRCVPARRRVTAAAAEEDPLVENVERAAGLLDLIIKETVEQVFVEEAVEEVIPGEDDADADAASPSSAPAAEVDKEAILRSVVRKHLGELDGSFMAALSAYVQVAESSGDFALLSMLAAIREEVLAAVTGEMQPDIQVVQLVSRLKSREQRVEVLRAAHAGGGTVAGMDVPAASIEAVETVAARLVDEMESQERVPNWQLLWQLLLVRETARQSHRGCTLLSLRGRRGVDSPPTTNGGYPIIGRASSRSRQVLPVLIQLRLLRDALAAHGHCDRVLRLQPRQQRAALGATRLEPPQ